jgi:hypothetical protein
MRENPYRFRKVWARKRDRNQKDEIETKRCQNCEVIEEIANQIKEFRHREELESSFRASKKRKSNERISKLSDLCVQ